MPLYHIVIGAFHTNTGIPKSRLFVYMIKILMEINILSSLFSLKILIFPFVIMSLVHIYLNKIIFFLNSLFTTLMSLLTFEFRQKYSKNGISVFQILFSQFSKCYSVLFIKQRQTMFIIMPIK